jgi:hypothetical protein
MCVCSCSPIESVCSAVLEEAGWPSASISQLIGLYAQQKDALRSGSSTSSPPLPTLSTLTSTSAPSIVDVSWRVDDYLRSDALDQLRLPNYLLALTTTQAAVNGVPNTQQSQVTFSCNLQQLQDLLAKLKDAQKQIQQRVE